MVECMLSHKVFFLMKAPVWGGAEYQMQHILRVCERSGYDASLIVEDCVSAVDGIENKVFFLNIGGRSLLLRIIIAYIKFFLIQRKEKFEIGVLYDQCGLWLLPFLKLLHVKTIYSERNSGETSVRRWIYRFFLKTATYLTCNSSVAKQVIEERIKKEVYKINNYVELPQKFEKKTDGTFTIVVPARISPIKNQEIILKAFAKSELALQTQILFCGKTDDMSYKKKLVSFYGEHLKKKVSLKILDFVDREELYSKADIVVLPSFSEGTPNVLLECFARKIPVIASNIRQNEELISNHDFLFDPVDECQLMKALIARLQMSDNENREELEKNYMFVKNNFNLENGPFEYVKLINSLFRNKA